MNRLELSQLLERHSKNLFHFSQVLI